MAILVMTELALYHQIETDSLKDLHQFLGIPDDGGKTYIADNNEEDFAFGDDENFDSILFTDSEEDDSEEDEDE